MCKNKLSLVFKVVALVGAAVGMCIVGTAFADGSVPVIGMDQWSQTIANTGSDAGRIVSTGMETLGVGLIGCCIYLLKMHYHKRDQGSPQLLNAMIVGTTAVAFLGAPTVSKIIMSAAVGTSNAQYDNYSGDQFNSITDAGGSSK